MNKVQLIGICLLAGAFSAATIGYSFFQPFHEGAVHEAIPKGSAFVFKVDSLDELLQSPVCSQLDKMLKPESSLRDLTTDNGWAELIASSEIAVAAIPSQRYDGRKTWAATSWVGWRSPWIRWKLEQSANPNLKLLGKHAVWPIWEFDCPELAEGRRLTLSLTDNLFLICISDNPLDILSMLDTYDQRLPPHTERK